MSLFFPFLQSFVISVPPLFFSPSATSEEAQGLRSRVTVLPASVVVVVSYSLSGTLNLTLDLNVLAQFMCLRLFPGLSLSVRTAVLEHRATKRHLVNQPLLSYLAIRCQATTYTSTLNALSRLDSCISFQLSAISNFAVAVITSQSFAKSCPLLSDRVLCCVPNLVKSGFGGPGRICFHGLSEMSIQPERPWSEDEKV